VGVILDRTVLGARERGWRVEGMACTIKRVRQDEDGVGLGVCRSFYSAFDLPSVRYLGMEL